MKEKPVVGQILYSLNVGNSARYREQVLTPVVVKSVGRKYFTVNTTGKYPVDTQYHLENWREKTEYSVNSLLYTSKQEWEDQAEINRICRLIGEMFRYGNCPYGVTLPRLKRVESILLEAK